MTTMIWTSRVHEEDISKQFFMNSLRCRTRNLLRNSREIFMCFVFLMSVDCCLVYVALALVLILFLSFARVFVQLAVFFLVFDQDNHHHLHQRTSFIRSQFNSFMQRPRRLLVTLIVLRRKWNSRPDCSLK